MFAPFIKDNLDFISQYFSLLLDNGKVKFPQSIILYGEDAFVQYALALNLAKILNCSENRSINCDCLNCNWIKNNNHPSVITVSKIDFKPDDDSSKTVISVKQTQAIKNMLSITSEYHRVFIICDAEIKVPNKYEMERIKVFKESNFSLPYESSNTQKYWIPGGITRKIFQEESANSMLKSIEEPPPNTTFIFLAKDKNDLIDTIISRSQSFYVPSKYVVDNDFEIISNELKYYPEIDRLEINSIVDNMLANAVVQNVSVEELLLKFQGFIKNIALVNANAPANVAKMIEDIRVLNDAQNQLRSYIKPQLVLENALYRIYKNWES